MMRTGSGVVATRDQGDGRYISAKSQEDWGFEQEAWVASRGGVRDGDAGDGDSMGGRRRRCRRKVQAEGATQ